MDHINFVDLKKQYEVIQNSINDDILDVLKSGQYILGPIVEKAEEALSLYSKSKNVVTVSSGTDALFVTLRALGVGPGSKVFIPSFTYTATAEVIVLVGAEPVFVDVDYATFNISISDLENKISKHLPIKNSKISAIIAVDLFGLPANYKELNKIAIAYELSLISDAAQSFGASIGSERVGKLAPITTTSFYPTKPLSCYGDGGAIFTDDQKLANIFRSIRAHGISDDPYDNIRVGTNARFDSIQAAILLNKIKIFDAELKKRHQIADSYNSHLEGFVEIPEVSKNKSSSWAHYTIKVNNRNKLRKFLLEHKIPTMVYYPKAMHQQTAYKKYNNDKNSLQITEDLCNKVISLPLHPYLDNNQVLYIANKIKDFIDTNG